MRILIAGCGYVGGRLAEMLADDGDEVFGLRRDPSKIPPGVHPVAADLDDPRSLAGLPPNLDAVVYAAGATGPTEGEYARAYVRGPGHLLARLEERGDPVRRFLFVSSTGVYAQDDGGWVDETSPTEPASFSGKLLLQGEDRVRRGPFPTAVLRLSGIYGPGRRWFLERVRRGEMPLTATPRYTNRVHREDCAGALRHLLRLKSPESVYLGVDHEPCERNEIVRWLAERLGVEPTGTAGDGAGPPGARGNKRCRNDRLTASGYRFRYPSYREGYGELLVAGT